MSTRTPLETENNDSAPPARSALTTGLVAILLSLMVFPLALAATATFVPVIATFFVTIATVWACVAATRKFYPVHSRMRLAVCAILAAAIVPFVIIFVVGHYKVCVVNGTQGPISMAIVECPWYWGTRDYGYYNLRPGESVCVHGCAFSDDVLISVTWLDSPEDAEFRAAEITTVRANLRHAGIVIVADGELRVVGDFRKEK